MKKTNMHGVRLQGRSAQLAEIDRQIRRHARLLHRMIGDALRAREIKNGMIAKEAEYGKLLFDRREMILRMARQETGLSEAELAARPDYMEAMEYEEDEA